MNYAELKWSIIQEWNSDAKFTNEYLIDLGKTSNVEIKNTHADRKSIIATIADGLIAVGVESGEYKVSGMGEGCDNPTLQIDDDKDEHKHEDGTVHSHPHEGEHSHDEEVYKYEDKEEEELPDFKKMSKKKLDAWAHERGIELDRRQTKANMITELKDKL
jgi:hypothetical protein